MGQPKTDSANVAIGLNWRRYWRRAGYEEEDGPVAIVATASPGTTLSIDHTFGPYDEDTYIRGLAKSSFYDTVATTEILMEWYDLTNAVQVDYSRGALRNASDQRFNALPIMWEGLLLTGNQLILSARAYKTIGGATVSVRRAKAWYDICKF